MARLFATLAALAWAAWLPGARAGSLRGEVSAASPNDEVLAQLNTALGESGVPADVEQRVSSMAEALRPFFLALPRSSEGYLEAAAVRYLLHRYFNDRDGWFVQGADAQGEVANSSLPEVMLKGGALARTLSERLAARGLSLREAAVLATALETLASAETVQRLHAAYRIVGLSHREAHASEKELDLILKVYTQMYMLSLDYTNHTWQAVNETWEQIYKAYPTWDQLQKWVKEVRSEVMATIPDQRFAFDGQVRFLEELQHRYGRWQDQECLSIKTALLQYATPGTGRVPLSTFYSASLPGGWKPSESSEYLQHMGALDEADPKNPRVVIPNYFETPSNCARPSVYYAVCCISECEALLGHLERKLASPDAPPQQILDVVEKLPSGTIEAPRTLPAQLVQKLDSIAAMHGGHAPMHGRLFRQWMHHAFPAECSYPSLSGTKTLSADDFAQQTGKSAFIDEETLQSHVEKAASRPSIFGVDAAAAASEEEIPWCDAEELFIQRPAPPKQAETTRGPSMNVWRGAVFLAGVGSMVYALVQSHMKSSDLPMHGKKDMFA